MIEIELKYLNIDVEETKKKLLAIGAIEKYDRTISSYSFFADGFSESDSSKKSVRVRDINGKTELTYKGPTTSSEMSVKEEIEVTTSDFDQTVAILENLGFEKMPLFTKRRVHYELGDIHFEIDTVREIPPYLEIETKSKEDMYMICPKLGLDVKDGHEGTIFEVLDRLKQ